MGIFNGLDGIIFADANDFRLRESAGRQFSP
jgi:hypothetical protein